MDIQTFLINILEFLNDTIMPLMIAVAGLFFIWNATRYFIFGGANSEDQERAKTLATWGIAAFVFIISLWGIVNLIVQGLNFDQTTVPVDQDYILERSQA